ncbi:MAG: EthD family reductase [Anaerolineales bacterium]|nr:EthD family reductase [Anaerolineales bacterium]
MILFRRSGESLEVETRWSNEFVKQAEEMPGLRRVSVSRVAGGPSGEVDLHMVQEFYFDDYQALQKALSSPEGQIAGQALMSFAAEHVTLCFAEHREESRGDD